MSHLCKHWSEGLVARSESQCPFCEIDRLRAENARLSALADRWNAECDEMREDNKRLANELVLAAKDRDSAEAHLAELFAQEPIAWRLENGMKFVYSTYKPALCTYTDVTALLPLYARPVAPSQAECTHDCNQGRDCRCVKGPA